MKAIRIFAVLLATAFMFTGCAARNQHHNSTPIAPPRPVTEPRPQTNPATRTEESLLEKAAEAVEGAAERTRDKAAEVAEHEKEKTEEKRAESAAESASERAAAERANERTVPAMSADFSQIGALEGEKKGWGPGGPVDSENRPNGATYYQQLYSEYDAYFIAPSRNKVYLTFDEGYENGYTAPILDTLKEKGVRAVFFVTLPYARSQPELIKRMIDEGHTIGNHSSKHLSFPEMPLEDAAADIKELHEYMKANYGYEMWLFRPPMGEFSEQTLALAKSLGYKSIFWSFAYRDWLVDDQPLTLEALNHVVSKCHPGAIYLLHAVSQTNAEILGDIIDQIHAKGLTCAAWDIY